MGGSSKIGGLGNNPPQVNLNEIENRNLLPQNRGNVGQSEAQQPVQTDELAKSSELVKQLDVLLLRAAKGATKTVDADALKTTAQQLHLSKKELKALTDTAEKISKDYQKLQKHTGRELASGVVLQDGDFSWSDNGYGEFLKDLLEAQAKFSEQLNTILNRHQDAETAEFLEEAMLQNDRRASELTTLVMQFADLANAEQEPPEAKARLDKKLSELLPTQAMQMHGNAEALAKMQEKVAPLAKRLDEFAGKTNAQVSDTEFAALRSEIRQMSEALGLAVKEGLPSGNGRVMVDRSLMGGAKKILDQLSVKFEDVRKSVGQTAMKKVVAQAFQPLPDIALLANKFRPMLKLVAPALTKAVTMRTQLKALSVKFADEPTVENRNNLVDAYCKYVEHCKRNYSKIQADVQQLVKAGADDDTTHALGRLFREQIMQGNAGRIDGDIMPYFIQAVEELAIRHFQAGRPNSAEKSPANELLNVFDRTAGLGSQVVHLCEMAANIEEMKLNEFVTTSSVRMAFEGKFATSSLVEARIHGMSDADLDPMMDDSRLAGSRKLGSGNANTVFEVTYNGGKQFVFKPETAGRLGIHTLKLGRRGYASQMQVSQINLAVQKTADTLGLGNVMVKTTVGSHQGVYGLFMEKAPGVSANDFAKYPGQAPADGLSLNDVLRLPPEQYEKVIGQLMHQLNRLQWFDAITGQCDRHAGNYFIHIGKDLKVTVKAIDNDMSFADYRIGLKTYRLTGDYAESFLRRVGDAQTKIFPQGVTPNLLPDPGVTVKDEEIIVDATKFESPELHYCLNKSIGLHDCALPGVIDQELYDKLMALKGGEAREAHLEQLRSRLSDEALDAAVKRLDDAIAHAEKLHSEGKVLTTEDFGKRDVQKKILNNNSGIKLPERNHAAPLDTPEAKEATKQFRKHSCDLFSRDLVRTIAKKGWFA